MAVRVDLIGWVVCLGMRCVAGFDGVERDGGVGGGMVRFRLMDCAMQDIANQNQTGRGIDAPFHLWGNLRFCVEKSQSCAAPICPKCLLERELKNLPS
jgi:hypothetical protein